MDELVLEWGEHLMPIPRHLLFILLEMRSPWSYSQDISSFWKSNKWNKTREFHSSWSQFLPSVSQYRSTQTFY